MRSAATVIRLTALLFAALLCLTSCADGKTPSDSSDGTTEFFYEFTDSTGYTVTLKSRPRRVAILFSSYADIWTTAGGRVDITVGESVERGFADGSAVLVDDTSGHTAIDLERLIAAAPDLVIGTADFEVQRETAAVCRDAGIAAALFRVEAFDDYLSVLKIFCDLTSNNRAYIDHGVAVGEKIDALLSSLDTDDTTAQSVLFVRAGSSARSTKAKTAADNYVCAMLDRLGTNNIADGTTLAGGELSLEVIMERNPALLFITTMGSEEAATDYMTSLLKTDGWRDLDCVKNGRVYFLERELFHFKPNSRWYEAYLYLAKILYPEHDFE